jgi:hypothetical protein
VNSQALSPNAQCTDAIPKPHAYHYTTSVVALELAFKIGRQSSMRGAHPARHTMIRTSCTPVRAAPSILFNAVVPRAFNTLFLEVPVGEWGIGSDAAAVEAWEGVAPVSMAGAN